MNWTLHRGDCRDSMRGMVADSIDAIVCDPPYGLSFMGKGWDHGVPGVEFWTDALRVAKPGAHLLAFGGTRTYHRLACAIEDAGWEIRDCVMWVYGSGFPKSHDVSKAIDKAAGAKRERIGDYGQGFRAKGSGLQGWQREAHSVDKGITAPATDAARQWSGWGTALKPAWEPVIVARKPLVGTIAENVQQYGTGVVNVDGCRVGAEERINAGMSSLGVMHDDDWQPRAISSTVLGRWPANVIHDGSEEVVGLLGDAARFFYCPKASKADRDEGCEGLEERKAVGGMKANGLCRKCGRQRVNISGECQCEEPDYGPIDRQRCNHHPTVKPTALMRYLVRLVTPPGGIVLDPFAGSGSTGKAAILEGFRAVLCELDSEYWPIIEARCAAACRAAGVVEQVEQVEPRAAGRPVQLRLFEE